MSRNAKTLTNSVTGGTPAGGAVIRSEVRAGNLVTTVLSLPGVAVTMTKNGTTSGGGGVKIYDLPEGYTKVLGVTSNLTVAGVGSKSNVAALGTVAAATDGTLTSTEANICASTTAATTSGAGTLKFKGDTVSAIDGTSTASDIYLNAALNADATGSETLTFTGTITLVWLYLGDN